MKILKIITITLLFIFFASLLVHSLNSINQDIGRHIKSGQIIWETKQVYKTNLFSFTEPNTPFINHHWLSEVIFYGLNNAIELKGLILFKAIILLLALGLSFASVYRKTGLWPLILSSLMGFMVFTERTDVRPEIFSYLFLAFFIFAIFKAKNESKYKYLYFLPLVQIFWTNMHIYFAVGPILLFFFAIDRFFEKRECFKKTALIFITTSAVTLLNPNFFNGALAPFNILIHYGYSIVENQNIFFLRDYGISLAAINIFELSLAILILSFIIAFKNSRRQITFEVLSTIFFTIMAGKMIRNFGLYGLAFIPIIALNLSSYTNFNFISHRSRLVKSAYVVLCVFLVFLIFNATNNNVYTWLGSPNRFGLLVPTGAEKGVEFVKQNNIKGPVFNNFDIGSFLIWKLYPAPSCSADRQSASSADEGRAWCGTSPDFKVFVDGRPEAYSVDFFEKIYKPMQEDPALWKKYSEEYKINYVFFGYHDITPWAQQFLFNISQDPGWPMVYIDNSVVIFLKRVPENEAIIKKFEIKNSSSSG